LLFEGLCKHWGFYFVAEQDTSRLGAPDLQHMIEKMGHTSGWITNVLESGNSSVALHGNSTNEKIAFNLLYRVLVARWLVLQTFITVAREEHNGSVPDGLKHAWLLFQILPSLLIEGAHVLVAFTTHALQGASTQLLTNLLEKLGPSILGSAFNADRDRFYYVVDEAQVAGKQYSSVQSFAHGTTTPSDGQFSSLYLALDSL
jgi:hypothetical protein